MTALDTPPATIARRPDLELMAVDDKTGRFVDQLRAAGNQPDASTQPLVAEDAAVDFRTRWEVIQQGFVDDPRNSVSEADKLVDDLLKRLSASFEEQHRAGAVQAGEFEVGSRQPVLDFRLAAGLKPPILFVNHAELSYGTGEVMLGFASPEYRGPRRSPAHRRRRR